MIPKGEPWVSFQEGVHKNNDGPGSNTSALQ